MQSITLKLISSSPLLMHSDRYANPIDPMTKRHKELTSKRKKTDEDHEAIMKSEWLGSLYWSKEKGIHMPTVNIRSCIIEGAKLNKLGMHIKRGTMVFEESVPFIFDGPKDPEELFKDKTFVDVRSVVVSQSRLMRCRPVFPKWECSIDIHYDPTAIDEADIIKCAENAGQFIGLGDFRPNKGGMFGRFTVEKVK